MSKEKKSGSDAVHDSFETLSLDSKVSFLLKATFSTAATAIEEIGTRVQDIIESVAGEEPVEMTKPPAKKASTAKAKATSKSKSTAKTTTPRKRSTSSRKTSARKTSTRKKAS